MAKDKTKDATATGSTGKGSTGKGSTGKGAAPERTGRLRQIAESYRMTKRTDPRIGWWLLGSFLVPAVVAIVLLSLFVGSGRFAVAINIVIALLFGFFGALLVFGRRTQRAAYDQMEGQPGAAAAALRMLRRGWQVDPVIAFTKQQDVLHRVVGPPGIVLVGEGNPNRLRQLMTSEHRKHERVATDFPVRELVVGNAEGQVPLPKLVRKVQKLGREVRPADMTDILARLRALDAQRPAVPIPKGPVPTSMKGQRGNLRGR